MCVWGGGACVRAYIMHYYGNRSEKPRMLSVWIINLFKPLIKTDKAIDSAREGAAC